MKKIFAIALALVMVLSMASAFAFVGTCGKYEYTCPTSKCGTAKAEVVQFVANNTIDQFEESKCAAVVVGQPIHYGVKVTFDKDVNPQWYYNPKTQLQVKEDNVDGGFNWKSYTNDSLTFYAMTGNSTAADVSGNTYWLEFGTGRLLSAFDPAKCIRSVVAANTRATISANVLFDFNGVTAGLNDELTYTAGNPENLDDEWLDYGSFKVRVAHGAGQPEYGITIKQGSSEATIFVVNGIAKYVATNMDPAAAGNKIYSSFDGTTFRGVEGTINANGDATGTEVSVTADCTKIDELMALVGIKLGDCVTGGTIKAIFGWENGSASKATWNKDALAIVNPECQVKVEIPKTGDVSVVAYAVMALVAAAGAMGLKK